MLKENRLWKKVTAYARQAGVKVVYAVLLLFYAYRRKETPAWAKRVIEGVIGYFLAPIDALPDLTPFIGYTDDLGVLSAGLATVALYVNDAVRQQARQQLAKWFGEVEEGALKDVEPPTNTPSARD